ncbi:MAG: hypothetical protein ACFFAH_09560 [Promethearchaeota archaeon]
MLLQTIYNLELYDFFDGLTATLIVFFGIVFSAIVLYKAKKMEARLLTYGAFMGLFAGLLWMGPCADFISVVFFGQNLSPVELYGILSYMWVAPLTVVGMYIGGQLMIPEKKKVVVIFYTILSIIFELFLFLDTRNAFEFDTSGGITDSKFVYGHPCFILIVVFLLSVFFLNGIGSLRKAVQSTGLIRKKFFYMATTFFIFVVVGAFDSLLTPGPILFIMRMGIVFSAFLLYSALKP